MRPVDPRDVVDQPQHSLAAYGFGVLTLGLSWAIINHLLLIFRPLEWNGPNIGGGVLLLLACFAIAGGVLLLMGYEVDCRRAGRGVLRHGVGWWIALALVLALTVVWATI